MTLREEFDNEDATKLRMHAYYYGFDETQCYPVDKILSAVACAGKSFHNTEDWEGKASSWPSHAGDSPIDWIQNAAIECAAYVGRIKIQLEDAQAAHAAQQKRVEELEAALILLIDTASMCDSWESFPSSSLEKAEQALSATARENK